MTPEQLEALDVARALAAAGIPVFVAQPDPSSTTGFRLPMGWQQTAPDPAIVDTWRPGCALALVMGHGLDLLDIDPRSGGDLAALEGRTPASYAAAATPSGGVHSFIRSLGVRSRDNVLPGIDVKAGDAEGRGRGFAFIAPTVRISKVTGQATPYRWLNRPDLERLQAALSGAQADTTGVALVQLIEQVRARTSPAAGAQTGAYDGPPFEQLPAELQGLVENYTSAALAGVCRDLIGAEAWTPGQTDGRGRGWEKLQADAALRLGRLARAVWSPLELAEAEAAFVEAAPTDETWTLDDVELKWRQQAHRGDPAPWPANLGRSAAERDAEAWAAMGMQLPVTPAAPGAPQQTAPAPSTPLARGGPATSSSVQHDPKSTDEDQVAETIANRALRGRYVWSAGLGWMRYRTGAWSPVTDVDIVEEVRVGVRGWFIEELKAGADDKRAARLAKFTGLTLINKLAAAARGILAVETDAFDQHPDLLCVGNGVVDLPTGELRPHDPLLLLTRRTRVEFRADAVSPNWVAALEALPGEAGLWLQVRLGQALSGHPTPDDVLPVLQGSGSNGKTTLLGTVVRALGEHAVTVPERVLTANPNDHPTELMSLRGARLALIEETPEGRRLSVKRLKDTLGTPTMTARAIRRDNVTWRASHSLFLTTNYTPVVDESDHGTWRRLALVRFPLTFTAPGVPAVGEFSRPGIPGIRERLFDGRQGQHEAALAWTVAGARAWYAADRVLPPAPRSVAADTLAWREEADLVLAYANERLVFDAEAHVISSEVYEDFTDFILSRGHRVWADKTFTSRFAEHSVVVDARVTRRRVREGAGLSRRSTGAIGVASLPTRAVPKQYTAWLGVRFRTEADDRAEVLKHGLTSADADGVQGVQGVLVNTHAGAHSVYQESVHTLHTPDSRESA